MVVICLVRLSHSYVRYGAWICATWLIHMFDMTHPYVCNGSFIRAVRVLRMLHSYVWYDAWICVTWLICRSHTDASYTPGVYDMTIYEWVMPHIWMSKDAHINGWCHAYEWAMSYTMRHDPCIYVTWRIHIGNVTRSYTWHDSSICVTWHFHMYGITHLYMWHDVFICVAWRIHDVTHMSLIWMRHVPHMHESCHLLKSPDSSMCVTWLIHMCDVTHGSADMKTNV